jgi:hypothetical protein
MTDILGSDQDLVARMIDRVDPIREVFWGDLDIQGDPWVWWRIEIRLPQSVVAFTRLIKDKPGDRFSKLILSMHNFFRQIETPAIAN